MIENMSAGAYRVRIVVDPSFGARLEDLPAGEPVWIIQSATNTPVAQRLWTERPGLTHIRGITTFRGDDRPPDEVLLGLIDTVDLHHGVYSADPPYSEVEVYGVGLTASIEHALRTLGFAHFQPAGEGFLATR